MATIPEAAVIEAAAAISKQLTDGLEPGDRARHWQQQAGQYRQAARAGLFAALPHMEPMAIGAIHERLLYGLRLGSISSYSFALAAACLTMIVRLKLGVSLEQVPYLIYIPAAFLTGFYCGIRPALVTVGLCGFFNWFVFIPPPASWDIADLAQGRGLIPYLIVASFIAAVMASLRGAIDRQRQAEFRQAIIIGELQQRTRNLLSIVGALSEKTAGNSGSLEQFRREYAECLAAIGQAQNLLWQEARVDLLSLVRAELAAHGAGENDGRISIDGPSVEIPPRSMHIFALAVHELATNSLKYGALGQAQAILEVAWHVDRQAGGYIIILWNEYDVRMPANLRGNSRGFGRDLIELALPQDLNAVTHFDLAADGVRCRMEIPLGFRI
jgi:two-component sensor histidine kinase